MIIVDEALEARRRAGDPLRVGIVGAGFMGRSVARQIGTRVPGMRVVAIANRTPEKARDALAGAGVADVRHAESARAVDAVARAGGACFADDPACVYEAESVEVVLEATGTVEFGAGVALGALEQGKHLVLCNAELDGTLGPVLRRYADRAGVVLSDIDGDQPASQLNLYRYVVGMGFRPVLCGNVKGLLDHYRTPETQLGWARRWNQDPRMVTSFADGSKISFEQAVVANAVGMGVARRGMIGLAYEGHVEDPEHLALWEAEGVRGLGGVVDYTLGARPGAGVYVLAVHDDPEQALYLDLYKLGPGPLYCFCQPFHLCYFEVPLTLARAALLGDAAAAPAVHAVDVVATAKRDLRAGESLDGIGGFMLYGQCENASASLAGRLLPIGLAEDCTLRRAVAKDRVLTYDDVELPAGRLCDRLRGELEALGEVALAG